MRNPIAALLAWLLSVCAPGSGRRRVRPLPSAQPSVQRPEGAPVDPDARARATRPRSPYGVGERLAGEDSALVRPYLVAYERQEERARQHLRRLSLVMAADFGIDLDARDVHAMGAAW
ncbi:hypothetical protein [Streptomyces poriferorum]|uniref:Uncharacterized protein n=1 Tax=Streptomyces poriferorum TaxID=2798799 RepID=A0ABY9IKB3_9ACTN|nr:MULTISPECIES: hypothetical protein [unclassified Streptomyces]MDP5315546.1 hypothetical protein [Streptomyces sp. Alt4]WLQ55605.1 hypothetical protein P8A19_09185 [Streptomyces sp. Alt2]